MRYLATLAAAVCLLPGADSSADARRGASLFEEQKCTTCHSLTGKAALNSGAPDLARRLDRDYTPAGMASRMWNHAPRMWEKMRGARVDTPNLSEAQVADLFAFFYASRYFERPGDAGRGKAVYAAKGCSGCHRAGGSARPAEEWASLGDPVDLVQRMWNHAAEMKEANAAKWPRMTSQEFTDLLVYLQNLPGRRAAATTLQLPAGTRGQAVLEAQGCTVCHRHNLALEGRLGSRTLTDIAASMWNHAPDMRGRLIVARAPELTADDMREVLAYLWASEFFRSRGDAAKGTRLFEARCRSCHGASGPAPELKSGQRPFSAITMVSALWRHGPQMLQEVEAKGQRWPELSATEMANLIAYLDGGRAK